MLFIKRARIKATLVGAVSVISSLGVLGVVPASAATGTAQLSSRALLQEAMAVTPAAPAGLPTGTTLKEHNCAVIHRNSDATEQSVNCADIWFFEDGGNSQVFGGNEVICEALNGNLADCSQSGHGFIQETVVLNSNLHPRTSQTGECGQQIGHSDCGTRRVENITNSDEASDFLHSNCTFSAVSSVSVEFSDGVLAGNGVTSSTFRHTC